MSERPRPGKRADLAKFLRSRRLFLQPETVGFERGDRRRTPGLKREEVAELAGIGVGWYTWLEQGRPVNVSPTVLFRVARALRLDAEESNYLFRLGKVLPNTGEGILTEVPVSIRAMLDIAGGPCMVFNARMDQLACNTLAANLYRWAEKATLRNRNLLLRLFNEPLTPGLIVNKEEVAQNIIGIFRTFYVQHVPSCFTDLFAELERSAQFRRMWADTNVSRPASVPVYLRLPDGRRLELNSIRLSQPDMPGLITIIHTPANKNSHEVLETLRTNSPSTMDEASDIRERARLGAPPGALGETISAKVNAN